MAAEHRADHSGWLADMATQSLLRHHPPPHSERFATYLIHGTSPYVCLGRNMEAEVFGETFGDSQETLEREYGPYDRASLFLAVVDIQERQSAGVLRVIRADRYGGLKTMTDCKRVLGLLPARVVCEYEIASPRKVWDVGTLAVREAYRGGQVSGMLYALLYQQCLLQQVEHVVTVLDAKVLDVLQSLGVPFKPLCGSEPFAYMGSAKSVACHMRVAEAGASVLQRLGTENPVAQLLARGVGLPKLVVLSSRL